VQKSSKVENDPSPLRDLKIDCIAASPTFLIAASPKRTVSPATLNCTAETFTSGGSTRIPIARHSSIYFTILSVSPISEVSSAAMNSTG
jgi:hypothetical protein